MKGGARGRGVFAGVVPVPVVPRSWASALLPPPDQLRSSAFRPVFPALLPAREVAAEPRELRDPAAELRDLRDLRDVRDVRDVHHPADLTRDVRGEEPEVTVTRLERLEQREDVKPAAEVLRDVSYKLQMVPWG